MRIVSKLFRIYLAISIIWSTAPAYALPDVQNVAAGDVSFEHHDSTMDITASDRSIINYNTFNIASQETVNFIQPSSTATVLNRIFQGSPSEIFGNLNANGIIFLINTSGIIFGRDASVNVGGLIASALDIADNDFLSGNYHFFRDSGVNPATVINEGDIRASQGGSVALIGGAVKNAGTIDAYLGSIALASGDQVTVSFTPDQLISVAVDEGTSQEVIGPDGERIASGVENTGTVSANGGVVKLQAKQVLDIFDQAVNQQGVVEARSVAVRHGVVELAGEGGTVVNEGTVDVSGTEENSNAGAVDIQGKEIIHRGTILANAEDSGMAGDVKVISTDLTLLGETSRIEAKGLSGISGGGNIIINSTDGVTDFARGAVIDVSGGALGGDAGFVELSGRGMILEGEIHGDAAEGYTGGTLFIDPLNIIISSSGTDGVSGGDSPNGVPDESYGEDSSTTLTFNPSSGGAFTGFNQIYLQATNNITILTPFDVPTAVGGSGSANLKLEAGNDINVNASVSTANKAIELYANNNITIAGNVSTTGSGILTIRADYDNSGVGALTQSAGTLISTTGAAITLSAGGDMTLASVSNGSGSISATSNNGSIYSQTGGSMVTGSILTFTADNNIGASGSSIGTTATSITANSTVDGDIFLAETNGVTLNSVRTVDGAITVTAGGSVTAKDVVAGDAGANEEHDINISSTSGSILVGVITADDDVTLQLADGASNINNSATVVNPTITGDQITLTSGDNGRVGSWGDKIQTVSNSLQVAGGVGGVYLDERNNLTLTGANITAPTGSILDLSSEKAITVTGDINLGTGSITLTADSDNSNTLTDTLTMNDGVTIGGADQAGQIVLSSAGDMKLETVQTAANITATSTLGSIVNSSVTGNLLSANTATLTARGSIGASDSMLNTSISNLDLSSTNNGSVFVNETNDVTLLSLDTVNGNITVTAGGAILDDSNQATVVSTTTLNLTAANGIGASGNGDIDTTVTTLNATNTGTGNIHLRETNGVLLSSIIAVNGTINAVSDTGNLTVGTVTSSGGQDINLVATAGSILDDSNQGTVISGNRLNATALNSIGSSGNGDLDTTVTTLDLSSTGDGNINIRETNGVDLLDVDTADGGITIVAGGAVTVTDVVVGDAGNNAEHDAAITASSGDITVATLTGDDDITLTASNGSILSNNSAITGDLLSLTSGTSGSIGTSVSRLNTTSGGFSISGGSGSVYISENNAISLGGNTLSAGAGATIDLATRQGITVSGNLNYGAANLILTADSDNTNTSTDNFNQVDGITITGTGDLTLSSYGNVFLETINTTGNIIVASESGSITHSSNTGNMLTGNTVTLTSALNIGTNGTNIKTTANILDVSSVSSGGVFLTETDGVTLQGIDTADGLIKITTGGNTVASSIIAGDAGSDNDYNVTLTVNGGNLTAGTITADKDLSINVTGSILDDANQATRLTGDLVTLTAQNAIGAAGNGDIDTAANSLDLSSTVSGDLFINETNDVTLLGLDTANGNIAITSGGAILDDTNQTTVISTNALSLTAANGIGSSGNGDMDTTVSSLDLSVNGTGSIFVKETDGVTLADLDTNNGSITITAGGATTVTDVQAGGAGSDVNITAASGNITTGLVTAAGDVTLVTSAANGSILSNNSLITGDLVSLTSGTIGAIGANGNKIQTVSSSLDVEAGSGGVFLDETNNLTLTGTNVVTASGATFDVSSEKALTISGNINQGSGQIILTADSDNSGTEAISRTAGTLTAGAVTLTATGNIGASGAAVQTNTATLDLSSTVAGDIYLTEQDGVNLSDVDTIGGSVNITTGGSATLTDVQAGGAGSDITITATSGNLTTGLVTAADDVTLNAANGSLVYSSSQITGDQVTLSSGTIGAIGAIGSRIQTASTSLNVTGGTGGVFLNEKNDLNLTGANVVAAPGGTFDVASEKSLTVSGSINANTGQIILTADSDNSNTATDTFTQADGTTIGGAGQSGNVTIAARGDVSLETITTTSNLSATSEAGDIKHTSNTGNLLTADQINLTASGNIGTGALAIAATTGTLDVSSTLTGDIYLNEANDVILRSVTAANGNMTLSSIAGSLLDDANQTTKVTGNVITLTAANAIGAGGNEIDTNADQLNLTTTNGSIFVNEEDAVTLNNVLASGAGNDVTITNATEDMTLVTVTAADDINLTAANGAIVDDNAATTTTGDVVALTAANGIGSSGNEIDTTASSLDLAVNGTGSIFVTETDGVILTDLDTNNGSITVQTGGATTITDVQASGAGNDISITATSGNITTGLVTAADDATLNAANGSIIYGTSLITGDLVTLNSSATGAIGASGSRVQTQSNNLSAAGGTGVFLNEKNNLNIAGANITVGNGGTFDVASEKAITVSGDVNTANGQIILTADSDSNSTESISWTAGTLTADAVTVTTTGNIGAAGAAIQTSAGTLNASSTVTGDIYVSEANDVILQSVTAADGNITLTSTGGSLLDDASQATRISGNVINFTAANAIGSSGANAQVDTSAATINAASTVDGDIYIAEVNGVTLGTITTADGSINITTGGDTVISSSSVISGDTNNDEAQDVVISASTGNITVGTVNSDNNAIITASTGSILDDGLQTSRVTGNLVILTAANDIGTSAANGEIDTAAGSLDVSSTVSGNIVIGEQDGVNLLDIDTADGAITITTGGATTVTDVAAADAGANQTHNVNITASSGDITVATLTADNNATVTATAGAILDDASQATKITGQLVTLTAANAIGSAAVDADIDTTAAILNAASTTAGDVVLNETDAVTLNNISAASGSVTVAMGGDATVNTITASQNVTLTSGAAILDDSVQATKISGQTINLTAADEIGSTAANQDIDTTAVTLNASSTAGDVVLSETNGVTLNNISATSGSVQVGTGGDATVATIGASGDVSLTSGAAILDDANQATKITGQTVSLTAADEVGSTATNQDIDTTAVTLNASSTAAGAVVINETDEVNLNNVTTTDGSIQVTIGGATTATNVVAGGTGTINLTASNEDITTHTITAVGDAVTIEATDGSILYGSSAITGGVVSLTSSADGAVGANGNKIRTTSTTLDVDAGSGGVYLDETNNLTLNGTNVSADSGSTFDVSSEGTLTIAGNINQGSGEILLAADSDTSGTEGIVWTSGTLMSTDKVTLTATGNIGAAGAAVQTNAGSLDISSTATGDIYLAEQDDVNLLGIDTADGSITITTNGATTVTNVVASDVNDDAAHNVSISVGNGDVTLVTLTADNNVTITASGGAIVDDSNQATRVSGNLVTLTAANAIGGAGNADIDTAATSLDVSSTSAGNIVIAEFDAVTLSDVDTADGSITITAGNNIVVNDVVSGDTNGDAEHDITLIANAGSITIGTVVSDDDVTLTASAGNINDDSNQGTSVSGDLVTLTAQNGIGSSVANAEIDTTAVTLNVTSTQSGSIFLRETDGVTLQSVTTTDGTITVATGGATTVTSIVAGDAGANEDHDVSLTVSIGNVTVTTITADNDATITASDGSILSNNSMVTGDAVTLTANNNASAIGASGNKIQTTSNTLTAAAGTGGVYIDETNNLNLAGNISAVSGGTFDVSSEKVLTVTTGINQGSGEIILTADSDDSNTAGDIFTQNDDVTIGGAGQSGNITIVARGNVSLETITTTGNITATSEAGTIQHTSNTDNLLTANQVNLTAGGSIGSGVTVIKTTANTISAVATAAGDILIDETDGVTFQTVTTTDGFITLDSGDDTTLVQLAAGDADANSEHDITVTASGGDISAVGTVTSDDDITFIANGGSILDDSNQTTVISGDLLTMTAQGSIGAGGSGDIDTTVNTINASSAGSGDILLRETDGITLNNITTADGAISITTGGATLATNIVASDAGAPSEHDITLTASSGNITVGTITADDDASITATAGAIVDDANQTTRIRGDVVTLSAGGAIGGAGNADIETTAVTLNASTTAAGDITISEFDNISLANITTNDGAINLTANGLVLATNLTSGDAGGDQEHDITVTTAASNISVGTITSDDDVILEATTGNVVDDGDQNTFITGDRITLTAEQEVGASGSGDIDTKANALDVSSTGVGNIFLNEFDGVDLADIDTADGTITITTGGNTTLTDVVTADAGNDDNHDITITAAAGNLIAVSATSDNNIILNANAGSILDDSNQGTRAAGNLLNLTARDSVGASGDGDLDTAATSLNVSSTLSGNLWLNELDNVVLADVDTTDGTINVTAGGSITATDVVTTDTGNDASHSITLISSGGSISLGTVTSDADVTVTASTGNINDDFAQGTVVRGNLVTLTAQNGIGGGANGDIDTTAVTLDVSSTQSGSIFLRETDGVTLQNVSTTDGGITITTGGATTVTNMTAADAGANEEHDVNLTVSSGNVTVTTITADDDAMITASNGSILSNNSMVTGDVVTLTANNGGSAIGASGTKIQTTSNSLSVSSGTGGVFLNEKNDLNLTGNVAAAGGDFDVSSEKSITVSSNINVGSGTITLTTDNDNSDTSTDTFTQADGTTLGGAGQSGQITINARGNVSLETITTSGNLAALSEAGAITNTSNTGNLLTANQITLTSDIGIGAGGLSMATTTGTLDLSVTGNGGIFIAETDGVNLLDLDTAGGTITVTTGGAVVVTDVQTAGIGSDISITANSGNMTVSTVTASDDVTLLTVAANSSILNNNSVITGDLISLTSGTNGSIGANGNKIQTTSNSLDVEAGSGGVFLDETNNLTITTGSILTAANSTFDVSSEKAITVNGNINVGNGQVILTADSDNSDTVTDTFTQADGSNITGGQIDITARGDISLETITTSQNVTIISEAGAITHTSSTGNMINGNLVTLTANGSIGTDTLAIATAADSLNVSSTGTGNIYLSETDGVDLADLDTINGSITVTTGGATTVTDAQAAGAGSDVTITNTIGDMTVATVSAADDVTLTATTGSVLDDGAATAVTGDLVDITAQNGIGAGGDEVDTTAASLNLSVTGAGNIFLNETDAATLTDMDTANGNITIQTGGAATVSDVQASGAGSDISITAATGDMTVTTVTAADDVTLVTSAANGSILSNSSAISGDLLTLTSGASGSIGASGSKIQTISTTLDVDAGTGGVFLDERNALTLNGTNIAAANNSTFDVSTEGTLTINGNINQGNGQILLTADSDSNGNEDISWTSGTLTTSDKITLTATGNIGAAGAAIRTSAGSLDVSSTARGNIVINDVDTTATELDLADIDTADGSITVTTANLVRASDVQSGDAGNNETHNVSITATDGNITVHTLIADGNVLLDAQNGSVLFNSIALTSQDGIVITASGSVGTSTNPLETSSGNSVGSARLDITSGSGGIFLIEDNPMDIDGINVRFTTGTNAALGISSNKSMTVSTNLNQGTGEINLTADKDANGDENFTITNGATIGGTGQTGAISITAGGAILDSTGTGLISGNVVNLVAASIGTDANNRVKTEATNLNITIDGGGTAFLENLSTMTLSSMTASNGGTIDLLADKIVDDGDQSTKLTANNIILQATNGIGAAGDFDIDTQASDITLNNTGTGNIFLREVDGATLTSIVANDGTISVVSDSGDLSIGAITSEDDQSITITATTGSILDSNSVITTDGAIALTSGSSGSIGASGAAIQTVSTSNLTLNGGTGVFVDERNDLNLNGSSVTVADGGNIGLSSEESIVLSGVLSAANGNVTLTADSNNDSTSETITQNAGASISGNLVTLTADAGIGASATAIQISAVSLDASVTAAGDLFINEADAVTLIVVDTANGSLDIRNASGDMTVTTVTATGGNATLVAQAANGSILSDNSTITANTVTLTSGASGSIGASGNKIQTVTSTHNVAAGSGGVFLDERNNLTLTGTNITAASGATFDVSSEQLLTVNGNINQGNGAILLTSDSNNSNPGAPFNSAFDTLTQADGTTIGGAGQSGNITLTSRGDMQLETVTTTGDLNIVSEVGTLTHTSSTGNRLTADDISLRAHGIGTSAQAIATAANSIDAEATSTADIFLSELDSVTLNDFDTADGAISITTGGATTINSVIANGTGKNVSITATSGDITVNEAKAAGDSVIIIAGNGSILDDGSNAAASVITANTVNLTASASIGASGNEIDTAASNLDLSSTVSGDIFISEANDVTLLGLDTANGNTSITTSGAILDDANQATVVSTNTLTLTAGTGIGASGNEVDTDAASLDLSVTAAGDIFVNENNAVTLADLDTANGSINIQTGGTATITDIQTSGAGNDINVTAANGDIATGLVTAADDVTLTATNGSVLYGTSVVTGDLVTLTSGASGSIGASGNKIQTTSITLAVSAGTGGVFLDETNALALNGANITAANGGTFDVSSEQSLTVNTNINQGSDTILLTADSDNTNGATENFTQNAGVTIGGAGQSGDITIATPNNAALGTVVTSGNLTVTAESGSITHSSATRLTGNNVTLTAAGNIGISGSAINTAAGTLNASSTSAGTIVLDEVDGVTLQTITTVDGSISITTGNSVTVGNVTSNDAGSDQEHDVTITATTGNITVGTVRADDDVTLDAQAGSILSNNSNIIGDAVTLKAFNNGTSIGSNGNKIQTTSNTLSAQAGTAGVFIDETNDLILDGANVTAAAGTFDISSERSLTMATSINRGTGSIILAADSDNSNTAANITDIFTQNDGVTIGGADQSGAISITAPGDVNLKTVQTTGDLTATSRFGAITHTSSISNQLTGNNVSLTAGTSIGSSSTSVMTTASSLNLSSTIGGDIFVTEADGATVNSAATANGNIQITSTTGDLTVNTVNSGSKDVTLTASAGSILDDSAQNTRITGNKVTLTAPNAIGGAGNADMDTAAATLEINSTSSGDINVNELDAVTLRNISAASGNVTITNASGDMTVNTVKGQAINLTAATGSILDGNGIINNLTGILASSLKAGGTIGKFSDPLEVNFTSGSLSVAASGSTDFFSVVINGTVPGNTLSIDAGVPGYVWFNGNIVGGQLKSQVTTEITIAMSEVTNVANVPAVTSLSPMLASRVVMPNFFALAKAEVDVEPVVRALASAKGFGIGPITVAAARPAVSPATAPVLAQLPPATAEIAEEKQPKAAQITPAVERPVIQLNLGNIRLLPVSNVRIVKPSAVPGMVPLDLQLPTMVMPPVLLVTETVSAGEILPGRMNPPLEEMLRQLLPTVEIPQGQLLPLLSVRGLTYIRGGNATAAAGQSLDLDIERILEKIRENQKE